MSDKHVCLIIPPSVFLLDERVFPFLGILKVASAMIEKGFLVSLLDLSGIRNYEEALTDFLKDSSILTFGITATTPQMPAVVRVLEVIRAHHPTAHVILGGPHGTLVHAAGKRETEHGITGGRAHKALAELLALFNVLVCGDGEEAIFFALQRHPLPGRVIDADDSRSPLFLKRGGDDRMLIWPARHLIDLSGYRYTIDGVAATSLISQLGCPFNCGFCGGRNSDFLRKIRTRPPQNVIAEVRYLYQTYGFRGFMFYDDELNVNGKLLVELMNGLADLQSQLGVEFRLRGFIKAELFTDEQAAALYRAGFRWILVGFESGSPLILENINKKATRDENTRCLEIAHRHGLKVKALMSVGHPGESEKTIADTRDWLLQNQPADFDVSVITLYPGTPYYDESLFHADGVWRYAINGSSLYSRDVNFLTDAAYYKGIPGDYHAFVWTDFLSPEKLVCLRDELESSVRDVLGIAFNPSRASIAYEHSMGISPGEIPDFILRTTSGT